MFCFKWTCSTFYSHRATVSQRMWVLWGLRNYFWRKQHACVFNFHKELNTFPALTIWSKFKYFTSSCENHLYHQTDPLLSRTVSLSFLEDGKFAIEIKSTRIKVRQVRDKPYGKEMRWLVSRINGGNLVNQTTRQESKLRRFLAFKSNPICLKLPVCILGKNEPESQHLQTQWIVPAFNLIFNSSSLLFRLLNIVRQTVFTSQCTRAISCQLPDSS